MGPYLYYLCNPAYPPPLLTHSVRGVDVRAGRQKDFCHLRMPMERRHVKWGGLALRGDGTGKDDTQRKDNK